MTALSGTHELGRDVKALPTDDEAAAVVREWLSAAADQALDGSSLDLRGADFSRVNLASAMLFDANLRGVNLRGADLYRAHLENTDFTNADLSAAVLVKTEMDDAVLAAANLEGADLGRASAWGIDARRANLANTDLRGASFSESDLTGAYLTGAQVRETSFKVRLDETTVVTGMTGTIFGPATLVHDDGTTTDIAGPELEQWLNDRGANIQVLTPQRQTP